MSNDRLVKPMESRIEKAAPGFEPGNNGFANRRLRPLGYAAICRRKMEKAPAINAGSLPKRNSDCKGIQIL
jgi:hypothetical protein